jgi:hypothetical protein
MSDATFAGRLAAMMRARDLEFISRSRLGTGLVSRGGRIFVVSYDDFSETEREILTDDALASFLSEGDRDPWGYTASVIGQARDALGSTNQTKIVRGSLDPPLSRARTSALATALLGAALERDGAPSVSVSDFPWFIDTTVWTTKSGVVRASLRRDVQNEARPHEHGWELETPSFTLRFDWTAGDAFAHYTIEGADEAVRDRVVDAVVKATS